MLLDTLEANLTRLADEIEKGAASIAEAQKELDKSKADLEVHTAAQEQHNSNKSYLKHNAPVVNLIQYRNITEAIDLTQEEIDRLAKEVIEQQCKVGALEAIQALHLKQLDGLKKEFGSYGKIIEFPRTDTRGSPTLN